MRIPPRARPRPRMLAVAAVVASAVVALGAGPAPAGAVTVRTTSSTSITVTWRGNGHGHGMSQYGARGAAVAGLTYRQILAFYYPHTTLSRAATPTIRVLLSDFGSTTTVSAWSKTSVSGVRGYLPTTGVSRYRLVADTGSGLTLQQLRSAKGSTWTNFRTGLSNRASFARPNQWSIQQWAPDGSSNYYHGRLEALRTVARGAGAVRTVDVLSMELYVAGVAPREMPASWPRAAVDTQAVAARTYAQYAIDHPRSKDYDICDTTACQFYGGRAYLDPSGRVVWQDSMQGAADTAGVVATYGGTAIFAQFSASNGGWTVAGGQPYLVQRADPYDNARSGDPYLAMTRKVSTASLARYYGLTKVTSVLTTTDGHGVWGGRTTHAYVYGVRAGTSVRVRTSGFELADALGAWTDWYRLVAS